MNHIEQAASCSNCQKRVVVCILYDKDDNIVGTGFNSCTPPEGVCARLQMTQGKTGYTGTECNSTHSEAQALFNMNKAGKKAVRAEVYGHNFACGACEKLLHEAGIYDIKIIPEGFGTGLRNK